MPKVTITDDSGTSITVDIDDLTSYSAGLGIKERAKIYIDPKTGKPYKDEVEVHGQLSFLEKAFKSVIRHERSG